jgi:L-aminopeptidase/D-esterase-like protein
MNGNGEMTGVAWIEESGQLETPITITNTHSCGVTRDATIRWLVNNSPPGSDSWSLPVAAETFDGELNDINGFHVTAEHTIAAFEAAAGGAIEMGSVGGGTGMSAYEFKAGSASASRLVETRGGTFTVATFVQANFGWRRELTILGVPLGQALTGGEFRTASMGSVIAIVATDAPLLPHQLARLARRVPLGLARTGTTGHNGSGDIFLVFSTANRDSLADRGAALGSMQFLRNKSLDPLFEAVVETVEEAVVDSMVANEAMTGANGLTVPALPHDRMLELMRAAGRI